MVQAIRYLPLSLIVCCLIAGGDLSSWLAAAPQETPTKAAPALQTTPAKNATVVQGADAKGAVAAPAASKCVTCHKIITPQLVTDWQTSKHSSNDVGCGICHGEEHGTYKDSALAKNPTPQTCAMCHEERVKQFSEGKHSLAWASMKAMPTTHALPVALREGMKGCGGCHKIGLKTEAEVQELAKNEGGYGIASCDACHTRHSFSLLEARQPQACQTCHMGFDHPQWEMYSASKHGVRYLLKQNNILPEQTVAPTCQTCHMRSGNHAVDTAWGFLAVRLPMPQDAQWAADRTTILQALGVLDLSGKPGVRLEVVKAAKVAKLTEEDWKLARNRMIAACVQCHSRDFAGKELQKGDDMIRDADHLMAEAIRTVASLYQDGTIPKPQVYAYAFPDLLTFHDAATEIEQKLFVMFMEHRMRAFQGAFHMNPDYSLWYGWSELKRDVTAIRNMAEDLRKDRKTN
jgi:hydroxylamine dehydrogenase